MVVLRRPSSFAEGMQQLKTAVEQTPAAPEAETPRAKVWRASHSLLRPEFLEGLEIIYESNAVVSFLFNSIVPHIEDRLRYDTLQGEYDKAAAKPDALKQNDARFGAIINALRHAHRVSEAKAITDADFLKMRTSMAALHANATIVTGLGVLYVSTKMARGALDLIFQRLIHALENDVTVVKTTDIPMEAMLLR